MLKKVLETGVHDTAKYRYIAEQDSNTGEAIIARIDRRALGTTAACGMASDANPRGWQIVYRA